MQHAAVLSHAIIGFAAALALFPFAWILARRRHYAAMDEPPRLGASVGEGFTWLRGRLPNELAEGGFAFVALFLGAFLLGCVANACALAWDQWGIDGLHWFVGGQSPDDPRHRVRQTAYMKLLGTGTPELLVETQTARFLYHLARALQLCAFASVAGAILLLPAKGSWKRWRPKVELLLCYALFLMFTCAATLFTRGHFDATLALALDSCGQRETATWLFPAFG